MSVALPRSLSGPWNCALGFLLAEASPFGRLYHRVPVPPGGTVLGELKRRYEACPGVAERLGRLLVYRLGVAYKYYLDRAMELGSKTNEEFQRRYWSTFTEYYRTKANEDYGTEFYQTFDRLFARAVAERGVRACLDVGCGEFSQILRLKAQFSDLSFIGNDLSDHSRVAYASLGNPEGIRFVPGSILSHADLFKEVDLFYTFGVLQYLSGPELERFFGMLQQTPRVIAGIVVEVQADGDAPLSTPRHRYFIHNYVAYFRAFGFDVREDAVRDHYAMPGEQVLFAYFLTRPSARRRSVFAQAADQD